MSQAIQTSFDAQAFEAFQKLLTAGKINNLTYLLPAILSWEGRPYTLKDHFPFESLFSTQLTLSRVYQTARQVSKSTSICARGVALSALIPRFKSLYVTPLFDQVRRLSSNYFRPLVEQSPIRHLLIDNKSENNVLQRTFKNHSRVHFGYAFLTADRLRGLNLDRINYDEAQDIDHSLIPIINEALSHSEYGLTEYTGTPKTRDGNLSIWWGKSSQAEWVIKCGCGHWNIPALEFDIDKMIGPYREDISEARPATICAKCSNPINPRTGRWIHRFPDKQWDFPGYHIPQIILPMHYANDKKWRTLLAKQRGAGNMDIGTFYNEVLGEAYDHATKLLSQVDLQKAAILHPNDELSALRACSNYGQRVLAIDWGGGGEEGVSLTTLAVLGALPGGKIDVIFGKKLFTPHDHIAEADECLRVYRQFECHALAHDYTGAGELRQTVMVHRGLPVERIIPVWYVGPVKGGIMNFHSSNPAHPRDYWMMDKTRSLQLTCYAIKFGTVRFFQYDYKDPEEPGLIHDFLALIENKSPRAGGSDSYTISRNPAGVDDFAQAVNIGCCALWNNSGAWPTFATIESAGTVAREMAARMQAYALAGGALEQFSNEMY